MIPFPCSKKHVLAKTSSGRPFVSFCSASCPTTVAGQSQAPPPNTNYAVFLSPPSYLRTLYTMQDRSLLVSPSFAHFAFMLLGEKRYLVFFACRPFALARYCYCCRNDCCFTNSRKSRLLLRQLSAVLSFFLPLLLCLSSYTAFFSSVLFLPSTLCPPCNFLQLVYK